MAVGCIVASYYINFIPDKNYAVAQQRDVCLFVEVHGLVDTLSVVFVIARYGIYSVCRFYTPQLLVHLVCEEGADKTVDQIAGDKDQVGLFGVNHFHLFLQSFLIDGIA